MFAAHTSRRQARMPDLGRRDPTAGSPSARHAGPALRGGAQTAPLRGSALPRFRGGRLRRGHSAGHRERRGVRGRMRAGGRWGTRSRRRGPLARGGSAGVARAGRAERAHLGRHHGLLRGAHTGGGRLSATGRRAERRGRSQGPAYAAPALRAGSPAREGARRHPHARAPAAAADRSRRVARAGRVARPHRRSTRRAATDCRDPGGCAGEEPGRRAGGGPRRGARARLLHGHRVQPLCLRRAAPRRGRRALRHLAGPLRRSASRRRFLARSRRAGAAGMLTVALPKGRLQRPVLERFAAAAIVPEEEPGVSRRLIIPAGARARFVVLKDADAAELGRSLRVATKYPRLSGRWFARRGVPVDLVHLSGSVELAAVSGLTDAIVDLVESGRTLEENGLVVVDELLQVSARLVVNRAAYRLKVEELLPLLEKLA